MNRVSENNAASSATIVPALDRPGNLAIAAAIVAACAVTVWVPLVVLVAGVLCAVYAVTDGRHFAAIMVVAMATQSAYLARPLDFPDNAVAIITLFVCCVLPWLVVRYIRQRREVRDRGWRLAEALEKQQQALVDQARADERSAMAAEMHDGLGHKLTLIAVLASQLEMNEEVPGDVRVDVRTLRTTAGEATRELGDSVTLLAGAREAHGVEPSVPSVDDVVAGASASGLDVAADIDLPAEVEISIAAQLAIVRIVQEALTNAAKHAAGEAVAVSVRTDSGTARIVVRNRVVRNQRMRAAGSRQGLAALEHRAGLLGGRLGTRQDSDFTLSAEIPLTATMRVSGDEPSNVRAPDVADNRRRLGAETARRRNWLIAVPAVLAVTIVVGFGGYFTYANIASIAGPETMSKIRVGQSQQGAEAMLPAIDMLDAPRHGTGAPTDGECHYYEAHVSFFSRVDVSRVCYDHGKVGVVDTIPARS